MGVTRFEGATVGSKAHGIQQLVSFSVDPGILVTIFLHFSMESSY